MIRIAGRPRQAFARFLSIAASAAALVTVMSGVAGDRVQADPPAITPGNLVVVRIGTGGAALSSAATATFLDEYTTSASASPVQSLAMPTADSGSNQMLTNSGTATSEGALTRSTNGQYVMLAGYDAAPGLASVAGTSTSGGTPVARIVGRVSAAGTVDTSTRLVEYSANNIRGAASVDGTAFWTVGPGTATTGALRYVAFGNAGTVSTSIAGSNTRVPGIFNGQLYASTSTAMNSIGTGLPNTPLQTVTVRISGGDVYGFVLFDRVRASRASTRLTSRSRRAPTTACSSTRSTARPGPPAAGSPVR